jgi:hypothetical protein
MKRENRITFKAVALVAVLLVVNSLAAQTPPEELSRIPMKDQLKYIEDHTKVYDGWRAIREDIYQKITGNFTDSLRAAAQKTLNLEVLSARQRIMSDSLALVYSTKDKQLEEITRTKNSISLFGININKTAYNSIMWLIVGGLALSFALGFIVFRRNLSQSGETRKELEQLRKEFEDYRQNARKQREKMSNDHFNELRKLKGGQ